MISSADAHKLEMRSERISGGGAIAARSEAIKVLANRRDRASQVLGRGKAPFLLRPPRSPAYCKVPPHPLRPIGRNGGLRRWKTGAYRRPDCNRTDTLRRELLGQHEEIMG